MSNVILLTFGCDFVHDPGSDVSIAAEGALEIGPFGAQILVSFADVISAELTAGFVDLRKTKLF